MEKAKRDRWLSLPNQRAWKEELQKLLCRSDRAVESALVRIYDLQTPLEKAADMSVQENGYGFNRVDAQFLSQYASMVKMGHHLTRNEVCIVRARILKYWKQLMVLSKQKLQQERAEEEARNAFSYTDDEVCHSDSTSDSVPDPSTTVHDSSGSIMNTASSADNDTASTSVEW